MAAFLVRAVVGGENNEGVFGDAEFCEEVKDSSGVGIHQGDHGGEPFFGLGPVFVFVDAPVGDFLTVLFDVPGFVVGVGDGPVQVEVKGGVLVAFDEGEGFFGDAGVGIGGFFGRDIFFAAVVVARKAFLFFVSPEILGVVVVRFALVDPPVEKIDTLFVGMSGFTFATEGPLSDGGGSVAGVLEEGIDGDGIRWEDVFVVPRDGGMTGVLPFEKREA